MVQSSSRWLQNTFSTSNGVASKCSATASTSAGVTKRKTAAEIDETADQPWAGDAIDLETSSRNPHGAAASVALGILMGRHRRVVRLLPADVATFEDLGGDVAASEPGRGAFAELLAFVADHDHRLARQARRPILNVEMRASHGARDQVRIGREVLVDAHVDEHRRCGRADRESLSGEMEVYDEDMLRPW